MKTIIQLQSEILPSVNAKQFFEHSNSYISTSRRLYETVLEYIIANNINNHLEFISTHFGIINQMLFSKSESNKCSRVIKKKYGNDYKLHLDIQSKNIKKVRNHSDYYNECALYELIDKTNDYPIFVFNKELSSIKDPKQLNESQLYRNSISTLIQNSWYTETLKSIKIDCYNAIVAEKLLNDEKGLKNCSNYGSLWSNLYYIQKFHSENNKIASVGPNVNRIYSPLTNLSKISRKHLFIEEAGNKFLFNEIDIRTAQIKLLIVLFGKENLDASFIEDAIKKDIYLVLIEKIKEYGYLGTTVYGRKNTVYDFTNRDPEDLRNNIKSLFYSEIYFGAKVVATEPKKEIAPPLVIPWVFKQLYPKTYNALISFKNANNESLAIALQNIEAKLINQATKFLPNTNFFTIHDAIFYTTKTSNCESEIYKYTSTILRDYNNKTGLNVSFKEFFKETLTTTTNSITAYSEYETKRATESMVSVREKEAACFVKQLESFNGNNRGCNTCTEFAKLYNAGKTKKEIIDIMKISRFTYLRCLNKTK